MVGVDGFPDEDSGEHGHEAERGADEEIHPIGEGVLQSDQHDLCVFAHGDVYGGAEHGMGGVGLTTEHHTWSWGGGLALKSLGCPL